MSICYAGPHADRARRRRLDKSDRRDCQFLERGGSSRHALRQSRRRRRGVGQHRAPRGRSRGRGRGRARHRLLLDRHRREHGSEQSARGARRAVRRRRNGAWRPQVERRQRARAVPALDQRGGRQRSPARLSCRALRKERGRKPCGPDRPRREEGGVVSSSPYGRRGYAPTVTTPGQKMSDTVGLTQGLPSRIQPGFVIGGKYRLEEEIGKGSMGTVYRAVHVTLGQRVAIKLISGEHLQSLEARKRFSVEAKAAAKLRSRHVVQVYDDGETPEGNPYIVLEYLDGETLEQRLEREHDLPLADAVRIVTH